MNIRKVPSKKQVCLQSAFTIFRHLFIPAQDPIWVYFILGAIVLVALLVRGVRLITSPFRYDEAFTFVQYASQSFKTILADYGTPNNHIFHTILVGFVYRLFGGQAWILRLPAFTAGVLMIPATYIASRRFFQRHQALAASALVATTSQFISFSASARGYTMLILFSLLLTNFAAICVEKQTKSALIAYAITGALGFYTIPIFLYPMAGISLWVAVSYLVDQYPWKDRLDRLGIFLATCAVSGFLALILYAPVILFGTGLESIIRSEVIETLSGPDFEENMRTRFTNTWESWMEDMPPFMEHLLLGGFFLSVIFYRKVSRQDLPLQVFLILAVAILLSLQRVAPLARVWLYLEAFYLMFSVAGLLWLSGRIISRFFGQPHTEAILLAVVLFGLMGSFHTIWQQTQNEEALRNRDLQAEAYVAEYLKQHLSPEDTIVAVPPLDITSAYFLKISGIPYERFYRSDHPVRVQNALVILHRNSKHDTPERVLDFYELTNELDLSETAFVYEYGQLQVYSVPAASVP